VPVFYGLLTLGWEAAGVDGGSQSSDSVILGISTMQAPQLIREQKNNPIAHSSTNDSCLVGMYRWGQLTLERRGSESESTPDFNQSP
jgi:hypothetical protein